MGQYYYTVNIDKKEFLHPHKMAAGLKLAEFPSGRIWPYTMALLLSSGNGRGGGDFCGDSRFSGRWAGDRIVVAGDYADEGLYVTPEMMGAFWEAYDKEADKDEDWATRMKAKGEVVNLHTYANRVFTDITYDVVEDILFHGDRSWLREEFIAQYDYVPFDLERNDDGIQKKYPRLYHLLVQNVAKMKAEKRGPDGKVLMPDLIIRG